MHNDNGLWVPDDRVFCVCGWWHAMKPKANHQAQNCQQCIDHFTTEHQRNGPVTVP